MVGRVLSIFGGRATHFLFGGVFIGLLLPDLASLARPLLMPSVATMLLLTLLRVDWAILHSHTRRFLTLGLAISWILLLAPLVTWLALAPNYLPPDLSAAVVLMAAAPPTRGLL